jgi:hypothetical protein
MCLIEHRAEFIKPSCVEDSLPAAAVRRNTTTSLTLPSERAAGSQLPISLFGAGLPQIVTQTGRVRILLRNW